MSNKFRSFIMPLAALLFGLALATDARPASAEVVIAVLDVPQIQRQSKAAKSIQAELEKQRAAYQAEIAKQEKSLRAADQQLKSQQATLSPEDYQKKRQEIEGQLDKLRQSAEARRVQLEKSMNAGSDQIRTALLKIVAEVAKARGATIVLNRLNVVWPGSALDITAETLKKLDEQLPKVTLPKS